MSRRQLRCFPLQYFISFIRHHLRLLGHIVGRNCWPLKRRTLSAENVGRHCQPSTLTRVSRAYTSILSKLIIQFWSAGMRTKLVSFYLLYYHNWLIQLRLHRLIVNTCRRRVSEALLLLVCLQLNVFGNRAVRLTWNAGASWSDALKSSSDKQKSEVLSKRENWNKKLKPVKSLKMSQTRTSHINSYTVANCSKHLRSLVILIQFCVTSHLRKRKIYHWKSSYGRKWTASVHTNGWQAVGVPRLHDHL